MTYPLAVQLYTLRHLSDDIHDLIKIAAEVGYSGVEGGYGPELDAEELREVLAEYNLKIVSAHVALDVLESNPSHATDYQKTLGNDVIVIPWLDSALYNDNAESWRALGKRFDEIAQQINDQGMSLLYHNHAFEFGHYEGKLGLEHLLDSAPELGLELDVGWCQAGGVDPLRLLEKYSGRVARIHVKDRAPEGENLDQGGWADVGHGVINWKPLLSAAKEAGTQWFIVEHDEPRNPVQTIQRSFDYLETL